MLCELSMWNYFSFHLHIIRENSVKCKKKGVLKQRYHFIQICFLTRIHTHFAINKGIHTYTHTHIRTCTNTHAKHTRTSTHAYEISTMSNLDMC